MTVIYCQKKYLVATLALSSIAANLSAIDITWIGVNNSETISSADVSDTTNWDTGAVPGSGDTAIFIYRGSPNLSGDISISTADTTFDPSRIEFNSNASPNPTQPTSDLYIDKNLNLTGGFKLIGSTSPSANRDIDRLRIGTNQLATTLTINGGFDMTTGGAGWAFIELGNGDSSANNSTVLDMTGDVTFTTPNNNTSISSNGVSVENDTNTLSPQMRLTTPGATITVEAAGNGNTLGTVGLNYVHLDVRSDQTWNVDPLGFISLHGNIGSGTGPGGKYIVESIDGGRLDNLGQLNIRTNGNQGSSASAATAMRMYGGTYGSLMMSSSGTSGRTQRINQTDHVAYEAQTIEFDGSNDPFQSGYGLTLRNATGNSDTQIYDTAGFDLDITNGVKFSDDGPTGTGSTGSLLLLAEGSNVTIGGDIYMDSPTRGPEQAFAGNKVQNKAGIDGGVTGMTLTVGGSFDTRLPSYVGRDNWINSNVTFTGASKTYEVGDASSTTGLVSGTYGVGTLTFGDGVNPASMQLVNDYLNNNPATTGVGDVDKNGEKLIVGTLNIAANSSLDVNGQNVEIVTSLDLDATASLDLNTGTVLSDGSIVDSFVGTGDQVSTWSTFESQIFDSSNPLYAFSAILDGGNTKWQAALVPEPSTYALAFAALMGIATMIHRRRK